jgi:hypothetical protein
MVRVGDFNNFRMPDKRVSRLVGCSPGPGKAPAERRAVMDKGDVFGNLMDWGQALDALDKLSEEKRLDEHQSGLMRILRYKGNWRLREAVLECVGRLDDPRPDLAREVMNIMADDNTYYDMRILAATALGEMLSRAAEEAEFNSIKIKCLDIIKSYLDSPQPPIFHKALEKSLSLIER